jgi:hypothetical protein
MNILMLVLSDILNAEVEMTADPKIVLRCWLCRKLLLV